MNQILTEANNMDEIKNNHFNNKKHIQNIFLFALKRYVQYDPQ